MATRTIEARFERMSVNDENDPLGDGSKLYSKSKVSSRYIVVLHRLLTGIDHLFDINSWRNPPQPL